MKKMNTASIMIPKVCTAILRESNSVRQGLEVMTRHGYTAIPVLNDENQYIGSVSEGDFLRHMMKVGSTDKKDHEKYKIREIMRRDFCPAVTIAAEEQEVIGAILNQNYLPVVDDRGRLCGIITRKGVISYLTDQTHG